MLTCAVLIDMKECGNEIANPKGYNYLGNKDRYGICDKCLNIGELEEKQEVPETGLFSCVWLRNGTPTRAKNGTWWAHYEIDSHHYYKDGVEITHDEYSDFLDGYQQDAN